MSEFITKDFKEAFIDKSLEKYGLTFKDVVKKPLIDGVQWNEHYTLTDEEEKNWRHWCIRLLEKKYPKYHPDMIKTLFLHEYVSIYGLKTV